MVGRGAPKENLADSMALLLEACRDYLPPDCYDIHAHLYRGVDTSPAFPSHLVDPSGDVGLPGWQAAVAQWMGPHAPRAGLFFANPRRDVDRVAANDYVSDQIAASSDSRSLMLIAPADNPQHVEQQLASSESQVVGVKVYHVYADRAETQLADIGEFLPTWAWELAHKYEAIIMLHIVRPQALADTANQEYLRAHCRRYPGAKLILAHAARGFCADHTVRGIASLAGLRNVYFDTSAICEPAALEAVLRAFGPSRLLFGSDFPVSEMLGRAVSIGDRFVWLDSEAIEKCSGGSVTPTLVGVESLKSLVAACRSARLVDRDVELIMRDNARQLLGLDQGGAKQRTSSRYDDAKRIIPGGTQLLSKRPEMFAPGAWPAYYREARGCTITDLDGREYYDFSTSGIGTCLLGFADPDVCDAVIRRTQQGSMSSLNVPEEVELAEILIGLHPWAEQVRYTRTGGEANAVAVRIARAATGRDVIAFCGYHGWSDWYLAANLGGDRATGAGQNDRLAGHLLPGLSPAGIPAGLAGTALPFAYNQPKELEQIVASHGDRLAAVIMEPFRTTDPMPEFLPRVRELCDACGAVLIFDEITSGWRFGLGGIHLQLGVTPDLAVFGKAMSNGFAMAAVIGKRAVMEGVQRTFVSSTYWTEGIGPAAAIATIKKLGQQDVANRLAATGRSFRTRLEQAAGAAGVEAKVTGNDALLRIAFDYANSNAVGTLFTAEMIKRGFLSGSSFYPTLAHQSHHLEAYFQHAGDVLQMIAAALAEGDIDQHLPCAERHSGFTRLVT